MEMPRPAKRTWINGGLFILTAFSIFFVGLFFWSLSYVHAEAIASGAQVVPTFDVLLQARVVGPGFLYTAALLVILLGHEFGHYLMCRRYGLAATLPYFIPFPNPIGTLGAFIRIKSRITNKPWLFDIGAAGPFAGFVLSLPPLIIGIAHSKVVPALPEEGTIVFGEPLLFKLVGSLIVGDVPAGYDVVPHPLAIAGWVGMLVTSINLLPVGQLDGGHIAYAVFGREKANRLSKLFIWIFLVMAVFFWIGWGVFALILHFIGLKHPPLADEEIPLTPGRVRLAVLAAAVFAVSFVPKLVHGSAALELVGNLVPSLKPVLEGLRFF
jgi:hypothetical protein